MSGPRAAACLTSRIWRPGISLGWKRQTPQGSIWIMAGSSCSLMATYSRIVRTLISYGLRLRVVRIQWISRCLGLVVCNKTNHLFPCLGRQALILIPWVGWVDNPEQGMVHSSEADRLEGCNNRPLSSIKTYMEDCSSNNKPKTFMVSNSKTLWWEITDSFRAWILCRHLQELVQTWTLSTSWSDNLFLHSSID